MREFLISPDYGAGWSSWNSEYEEFLLFDAGLIELAKKKASEEEVQAYIKSKLGTDDIYTGGWINIVVGKLKDDEEFIVEEYDGFESIRVKSQEKWK
jgi:hypothetical protein